MHIWKKVTAKEKRIAQREIDLWNMDIEMEAEEKWEEQQLQRDAARVPG